MKNWLDPIFAPWNGNASALARELDELPVTVNQWRFRGFIPDDYRERIIVAAAEKGHALTHRDFIHPDKRLDTIAVAAAQ